MKKERKVEKVMEPFKMMKEKGKSLSVKRMKEGMARMEAKRVK